MYMSLQFKLQLSTGDKKELWPVLKRGLSQAEIYSNLRHWYSEISSSVYKAKQYPTDKKVAFGEKTLFEKLCKNRDKKSKARQKLKQGWPTAYQAVNTAKEKGKAIAEKTKLSRGKKAYGRSSNSYYEAWQILRYALLFPVLWSWVRRKSVPKAVQSIKEE